MKKKEVLVILILAVSLTILSFLWRERNAFYYVSYYPWPLTFLSHCRWWFIALVFVRWLLVLAMGWWVVKKFKMQKSKLKIGLVGLLAVGAVLVAGWLVWSNQSLPKVDQPAEIIITTDKTEYEQGETVKITIRNGLDKSIFGGFGHCGGLPFWGLQKFDNGDWRDLDFSLPYSEKGKEVCDLILCEREEPAELKSGLTIEDRWHLTSICKWPEKPIGVPKTEPKPIEEGAYRVRLIYGLNRREFDLLETKTIYSNEFMIKEKEVVLDERYCEKNIDCACGVHIETRECFYGNIKYVLPFPQCPDFCTGFAGNLRIRCVNNECKQVAIE